ncbi:MAG: ATP-binding protein, partial [Steroidobacter sp.]
KQLIEQAQNAFASRIHSTQLNIEINIGEQFTIRGEQFLLQQAVANLLDNAIDFTPDGGTIRINASGTEEQINIVIFNQGDLIPEFALPRLTERFYSLPRPGTGRKSTGLGLNFVKEVAELHNGSLSVVNTDNGVEVTLKLSSSPVIP